MALHSAVPTVAPGGSMYSGCIEIERVANGWEVEFREPDKVDKKGNYISSGKCVKLVYTEKDKAVMVSKVEELVDELKAPTPSQEYSAAFDAAAKEE